MWIFLVVLADSSARREHENIWRRNQGPSVTGRAGAVHHSLTCHLYSLTLSSHVLLFNFSSSYLFLCVSCDSACLSLGTNYSESVQYEQWQTPEEFGNCKRGEHTVTGKQRSGRMLYTHRNLVLLIIKYILLCMDEMEVFFTPFLYIFVLLAACSHLCFCLPFCSWGSRWRDGQKEWVTLKRRWAGVRSPTMECYRMWPIRMSV